MIQGDILSTILNRLADLGRVEKRVLVTIFDAVLCIVATWIAFSLRLGEWMLSSAPVRTYAVAALFLWLPIAYFRGVYRAIFRVAGAGTMIGLARACAMLAIPLTLLFVLFPVPGLPRTISILQPLIFFVLLCLSRITARYLFIEVRGQRLYDGVQKRVLIYGAGASGQQLAASIRHEPSMCLCAYIDDDKRLDGQVLDGIPIYHSGKLGRTVEGLEISDVLLAIPAAGRSKRKKIVRGLEQYSVHVQTLPNMRAIMDGRVSINDLRELKVEDLLGRDPVAPNQLLLGRTIVGKTVLVTGAGGSIGGELCRQWKCPNMHSIRSSRNCANNSSGTGFPIRPKSCPLSRIPRTHRASGQYLRDAGRRRCSTRPPISMCRWLKPIPPRACGIMSWERWWRPPKRNASGFPTSS
jgi:FlaA1/EpsC-like NDP-sugar epimerase